MVKVNDYVKKGDLLVSNTVTSTSGVNKIIETQELLRLIRILIMKLVLIKINLMMVRHLVIYYIR